MSNKFQIRLISPWTKYIETETAIFSSEISEKSADALLCEWKPSNELLTFSRRKAWYCCEPQCQFNYLDKKSWPQFKSKLNENEFIFHRHENKKYRVPHITHFTDLSINKNTTRKKQAIAVVSNFGGSPFSRHKQINYRNKFITNASVDLFGRASWHKYKKSLISIPKAPNNYQGEIAGDWPALKKRELLSQYKVCICLENMLEPHYFTEKFVEAVSAGCIPIYRAHTSLVSNILKGAKWVDPSDYDNDPQKTIEAALEMDLTYFQESNSKWLKKEALIKTHHDNVFGTIGKILQS